ncbi:hypothetical protein QUF88_12910 [Bacillus sp. DX1.1]|uniref:hypothetical protein n=1 Tax=unclassified Bacillus (in: firmicutes) TaxID=185979 RepID=UPI0025705ECB|nr:MULTISPECIES: hypothetical protein [unclassified Bacillus (in: firmicutes)]MDM5154700.1 hypothetical protein [Bacillus sp. DX1.1]WJE83588.1 hypothetical protein QRE67_10405 [Bacillus sp. DX3.1]
MNTNLNAEKATELAQLYIKEHNVPWIIKTPAQFHQNFFSIHGNVWIVEAELKLNADERLKNFIISDEVGEIEYIAFGIDIIEKINKNNPKLNTKKAIEIVQDSIEKGDLVGEIEKPIFFYENVMDIECYAWVVDVKLPPSQFDLIGDAVFISDESGAIEDIRNL